MITLFKRLAALALVLAVAVSLSACGGFIGGGNAKANRPLAQATVAKLKAIGSSPGAPMMVRIFKQSSELEVWKQTKTGQYALFSTYKICAWSGELGPKIKEGDRQSPEGFYTITPALLNPNSSYYLSFNTGFPNKFDRAHGRTGSDLMVHGDCSSRGCYAMTDEGIAEIYALARETFKGGNPSFQLQIFPFRMTAANMAANADNPNMPFWKNIKEGYDRFELALTPPVWDVCEKRYVFDTGLTRVLDASAACPVFSRSDAVTLALMDKQSADEAAMNKVLAGTLAQQQEQAAIKARGEAIGNFIGSIFGNGSQTLQAEVTPEPQPAT